MNENSMNIPDHVFDWIDHLTFDELNETQKSEVLIYMNESDFKDLHFSSTLLNECKLDSSFEANEMDALLLKRFDAKHLKRSNAFNVVKMGMWSRAAIVFIVCSVGFMFVNKLIRNDGSVIPTVTGNDTGSRLKHLADTLPLKRIDTLGLKQLDTLQVKVYKRTLPKLRTTEFSCDGIQLTLFSRNTESIRQSTIA